MILTETQIKAFENGATMFIVPINEPFIEVRPNEYYIDHMVVDSNYLIDRFAPVQIGDKDVFIQKEFCISFAGEEIRHVNDDTKLVYPWKPVLETTEEESRYSFKEIIDIRVVRVRDIMPDEWFKIGQRCKVIDKSIIEQFADYYNTQLKEQNINRTYEDNDYVFLIEAKEN